MKGAPAKPISVVSAKPSRCQAGADQAHRLHDRRHAFGDLSGVQRGDAGLIAQFGENRALAFLEFQAVPERPGQHEDVAEQDRGVEAVAADRLQRDLGGQVRAWCRGRRNPSRRHVRPGIPAGTAPPGASARPAAAIPPPRSRSAATVSLERPFAGDGPVPTVSKLSARRSSDERMLPHAGGRRTRSHGNNAIAWSEAAARGHCGRTSRPVAAGGRSSDRGYQGLSRRPLSHRQQPS